MNRQPSCRSTAIVISRRASNTIALSLLSATFVLWIVYLPILTGYVLTQLNVPF